MRKKHLALTPEEWVRQHFVHYLIEHRNFPKGLLKLENAVKYHQRSGRYDAVFLDRTGKPFLLVECKAPTVKITQETFDQVKRYNTQLNAPYIAITNGLTHFFMKIDFHENKVFFLDDIPHYQYLSP